MTDDEQTVEITAIEDAMSRLASIEEMLTGGDDDGWIAEVNRKLHKADDEIGCILEAADKDHEAMKAIMATRDTQMWESLARLSTRLDTLDGSDGAPADITVKCPDCGMSRAVACEACWMEDGAPAPLPSVAMDIIETARELIFWFGYDRGTKDDLIAVAWPKYSAAVAAFDAAIADGSIHKAPEPTAEEDDLDISLLRRKNLAPDIHKAWQSWRKSRGFDREGPVIHEEADLVCPYECNCHGAKVAALNCASCFKGCPKWGR